MKPHKIMVVDDEEATLQLTCRILIGAGYQVTAVQSGLEGLVTVQTERPDLVVLDVAMPDLSGLEVCSLIKSDPLLKDTYVLLVSGLKITSDSQADGLEAGADDYLTAPFSKRELLTRVRNLITLKKTRRALKLQVAQQQLIAALGQAALRRSPLSELFAFGLPQIAQVLSVPHAALFAYDGANRTLTLTTGVGWPDGADCLEAGPDSWIRPYLYRQEPVIVDDLGQEPNLAQTALFAERPFASLAITPLHGTDTVFGMLLLAAPEPAAFTPETAVFLQSVANVFAGAIAQQEYVRALQQSMHKFSSVIAQSNYGFIIADEQGTIIHWNPAQETITGMLAADAEGARLLSVFEEIMLACRSASFSMDQILADIDAMLAGEKVENEAFAGCVYDVAHRRGDTVQVHLSLFPIFTDLGNMFCVISRDVTKEIAQEAIQRQQQRLAAVGRLAGGIAHEFNNFLAAITMYTDMIRLDPLLPPQHQKRLNAILTQSREAAELVTQFLDFSRGAMVRTERINLSVFLEEQMDWVREMMPERIHVQLRIDAVNAMINADPLSIQKIVRNLSENARDAMPDGGELTFTLSTADRPAELQNEVAPFSPEAWSVLTVADTGFGIKAANLERVFEPFFSTQHPSAGKGLGLAQVHGIVYQQGGAISVASEPGRGSVFSVYFPRIDDGPGAIGSRKIQEAARKQTATAVGQIMLVEANESIQIVLHEALAQAGYALTAVSSVQEGVSVCRNRPNQFALMLVNAWLLGRHDSALLRELCSQDAALKLALIIDRGGEADVPPGLQPDGLIRKPFDLEKLLQTVGDLLGDEGSNSEKLA